MNLLEGRVAIPPGAEHPLQYAFVEGLQYPMDLIIYGTENLDDDEVLAALLPYAGDMRPDGRHRLMHLGGYRSGIRIERYNRCPACEQWSPCKVRIDGASD